MMKNIINIENNRDFPFYNKNPHISLGVWVIILLSVLISFIGYIYIASYSEFWGSIFFCGAMLIPLLYFSNWNYNLLFSKPTKNEVKLAFLMFLGYIIYALIMGNVLDIFGFIGSGEEIAASISWETVISLVFSMMGEELLKFIPLMFFMRLFYKLSERRNFSMFLSSIIVLTTFGLLHYTFDESIIMPLMLQGVGSIFELYGYLKTKNLFVPYLSHLFTDAFIMILILIGL